jgi:hypothetical protein
MWLSSAIGIYSQPGGNVAQPYRVVEVLNYGGFFAGDTVSLIARPLGGGDEQDFTIDEHVFQNIKDRYKIVAEMVLSLDTEGDKVTRASLVGGPSRDVLRDAIDPAREQADPAHKPYRVFAYRCPTCNTWVRGEPNEPTPGSYQCRLCASPLG